MPVLPYGGASGVNEAALREKALEAGAIWRPRQKLWEMPLETARRLGLGNRIVSG